MNKNRTLEEYRSHIWTKVNEYLYVKHTPIQNTSIFYVFLFEAILGSLANLTIIFVFIRNHRLRTQRNIYIINMVIGNLLNSVTLIPLVYIPQASYTWPYDASLCKVFNAFTGLNFYSSTFSIMAISIDRYYYVKTASPTSAFATFKGSRLAIPLTACLVMWFASFGLVSPLAIYYNASPIAYNMINEIRRNGYNVSDTDPENVLYFGDICALRLPFYVQVLVTAAQTAFLLPLPLTVMSYYMYRLQQFLRLRERLLRQISISRARRSRNVTLLLVSMVGVFALLWLPFHIITVMYDFDLVPIPNNSSVDEAKLSLKFYDTTFQLIGYTSLFINPLLYGFLNHNFKKAIIGMFKCERLTLAPSVRENKTTQERDQQLLAENDTQL